MLVAKTHLNKMTTGWPWAFLLLLGLLVHDLSASQITLAVTLFFTTAFLASKR